MKLPAHAVLLFALSSFGAQITVDNGVSHQVIEGFGASTINWNDCGIDALGAQRQPVLEVLHRDVKLAMGDMHCVPHEAVYNSGGCGWEAQTRTNDDANPNNFNWAGFDWWRSDFYKTKLVDIASPLGFDNYSLSGRVSSRWHDTWLNTIRSQNYNLYLQEAAENAVAILVHWRDSYGIVPRWHQPFNEPLSGNYEVDGGSTQEVVDLVKAIGAKMRAEGFDSIRMVAPSEETEEKSLQTAQAILNDPVARQYVGAIGYHTYPYGSIYSDANNVLSTSGAGKPNAGRIAVRTQLKNLAKQYGLQTWMTEVSHSNANAFTTFRARAIHIHDEMMYTDASSFWGMFNMYDQTQASSEDHVVLFNTSTSTFRISGMGRAIGHYARFLKRGAVRIDAQSGDSLVQVTAFRDDAQGKFVVVLINNASLARTANVNLSGMALTGNLTGEQSTASAYWTALAPQALTSGSGFSVTLPAQSVTSLSAGLMTTGSEGGKKALESAGIFLFPNPLTSSTEISIVFLPAQARSVVSIRDLSGRLIRQWKRGPSVSKFSWDGRDALGRRVVPGAYVVSAQWGSRAFRRLAVVIR